MSTVDWDLSTILCVIGLLYNFFIRWFYRKCFLLNCVKNIAVSNLRSLFSGLRLCGTHLLFLNFTELYVDMHCWITLSCMFNASSCWVRTELSVNSCSSSSLLNFCSWLESCWPQNLHFETSNIIFYTFYLLQRLHSKRHKLSLHISSIFL